MLHSGFGFEVSELYPSQHGLGPTTWSSEGADGARVQLYESLHVGGPCTQSWVQQLQLECPTCKKPSAKKGKAEGDGEGGGRESL